MAIPKKQHEGFAKFFEAPTRESLRDLLKANIGETDYLDFKEEWPELAKVAKHILGLSNSGGGALVVGVRESKDASAEPVGLASLKSKEDIAKFVAKTVPQSCTWEILDFSYKDSEYPALKGKKFQVLLVEYDAKSVPILALKDGDGIKGNCLYVRRGVATTEGSHTDLQKIINERIETGYSSSHLLELSDHLAQLKELYLAKEAKSPFGDHFLQVARILHGDQLLEFRTFVDQLIELKRKRIIQVLDV